MVMRRGACSRGASFFFAGLLGLMLLGPSGPAAADSTSDPFGLGAPAGAADWSGIYIGAHGGYGWGNIDYAAGR